VNLTSTGTGEKSIESREVSIKCTPGHGSEHGQGALPSRDQKGAGEDVGDHCLKTGMSRERTVEN